VWWLGRRKMNVLTQLLIFVVVTVVKSHDEARRQGYRSGLDQLVGEKTEDGRRMIKRDTAKERETLSKQVNQ
jgi:hypothetical protein